MDAMVVCILQACISWRCCKNISSVNLGQRMEIGRFGVAGRRGHLTIVGRRLAKSGTPESGSQIRVSDAECRNYPSHRNPSPTRLRSGLVENKTRLCLCGAGGEDTETG